jgi:MFS family permease
LRTPRKPFYGWAIVAAVLVVLSVTSGLGFYNASVILSAATDELDASVGAVSGATGLFFAISGLAGFVLAKSMETIDLRWFFLGGGIAGSIALYGLRWVDSVLDLYIFFAVFGIGFGSAGLVPATTLVTRWFDRRRSIAISIASTGLSLGGIVLTPVAAYVIHRNGLANAGTLLSVMWIIGIVPVAVLVIRPFPSSVGLRPDGDPATAPQQRTSPIQRTSTIHSTSPIHGTSPIQRTSPTPSPNAEPPPPGATFVQARTSRFFLGLCAAYLFIFFGQVGALAQLFNMVQERTDPTVASTTLSVLALASVVARLVGGVVVLRVDTRSFTIGLILVQVMSLALLGLAGSAISLVGFAVVFGMAIGNLLMLQPLLLAEAFGVAEYGRIYSTSQLIGTVGVAAGPFALGLVRDAADYRLAFMVAAVASLLGAVALAAGGSSASVKSLWI